MTTRDNRPDHNAPKNQGDRGRGADRRDDQDEEDEERGEDDAYNKDDIIHRQEDSYEHEIAEDPEKVMFRLRANRKAVLAGFFGSVLLGAVLGIAAWYELHEKTFFIWKNKWILQLLTCLPAAVAAIASGRRTLKLLTKRFAISRRYIRSEMWLGIDIIDSCDMTTVMDVRLTQLGPVSNLTVITTDKLTPKINMELISTREAKEAFGYLTAHAQSSYIELRRSRRFNRGT